MKNQEFESVQRLAKRLVHGCEKFVPALAYLFCFTVPGSCLARFAYLLADLLRLLHCPRFPHITKFRFGLKGGKG